MRRWSAVLLLAVVAGTALAVSDDTRVTLENGDVSFIGIVAAEADGTKVADCTEIRADDQAVTWTGCTLGAGPTAITGAGGCIDGTQVCDPDGFTIPSGVPFNASSASTTRLKQGTAAPSSTCTAGEFYTETDVAPPFQLARCIATNTNRRIGAIQSFNVSTVGPTSGAGAGALKKTNGSTQRFMLQSRSSARVCSTTADAECVRDSDCPGSETCTGSMGFERAAIAFANVTVWAAWCALKSAPLTASASRTIVLETQDGTTSVSMTFGQNDGFMTFTSTSGVAIGAGKRAAWKTTTSGADSFAETDATCTLLYSVDSLAAP